MADKVPWRSESSISGLSSLSGPGASSVRLSDPRLSSVDATIPQLQREAGGVAQGLKVNAYDRTASLIIAMLLMVGATVLGLLVVFFSDTLQRLPPSIPVTPISSETSRAPSAGEINERTPGLENAPEQIEPDFEDLLDQLSLAATDDTVLFAEQAVADAAAMKKGQGGADTRGTGVEQGDGTEAAREPQRVIRFEPESLSEYARWYDNAGLEIGVLGSDNVVYYASQLSNTTPTVRTGLPEEETRLYFNSSGTPLARLDRLLAEKAGIADRGQILLQFFSEATAQELLRLEREAAGDRSPSSIYRSVFRVTKKGEDQFEFSVEEQTYAR